MCEELIEYLYQVSLGKVSCDDDTIATIERSDASYPGLANAATHALIIAEYRQELAEAESDEDAAEATSIKRKIDIVEGEILKLFESMKSKNESLLRSTVRATLHEIKMKGLYKQVLLKYPNVPEYVIHDMWRGDDEKFFAQMNRLDWKLKIIEVNPGDFCSETQQQLNDRKFGSENPYQVPDDEKRMLRQKELVTPTGNNEPIIVIKRTDGYRLYEGWHRTMNALLIGKNSGTPEQWNRVKIKAWVGSSRKP